MNIQDNYYRLSIKALILDSKQKFLLLKEANGKWELPGGGLEFGETPVDCIKREMLEETGLIVTEIKTTPCYLVTGSTDNIHWKANILFETKVKNLNFIPSNECIDLKFFTAKEAIKLNTFSSVINFIKVFNPQNHC